MNLDFRYAMAARSLARLAVAATLLGAPATLAAQASPAAAPADRAAPPSPFPAATPESQGLATPALRELADVVRGYVAHDLAVGAELLVVKNRRTVLHEAFGMADREKGVAMAPGTIFNLRSMTKMFTGAAIQMLIDQGDLEPSMKAADFLEGFRNEKSEPITIEQLLEHRSGLPLSIIMKTGRLDAFATLLDQANAIGAGGPEFPPDSKFWYSDSGSDALAAIVEVVTGKGVAQFVSERLFAPLGMDETFYLSKTTPHDQARVASLYLGSGGTWTRGWSGSDPPIYPFPWGSQTAFGTTVDYARFLALLLDHGKVGTTELLTDDALARILTPRSPMMSLGSDSPFPTGFRGLTPWYGQLAVVHRATGATGSAGAADATDSAAKPVVIGHSGSDGTNAWAFPDHDLMILYFTQSRGGLTPVRLEQEIDRLLLHPGAPEPAAPARLAPYVARYHLGFAEVRVLAQDGHLAIDLPDSLVFALVEPAVGVEWNAPTAGFSVSFDRTPAGVVTGLELHSGKNARRYVVGAAPKEPAATAAELAALVGDWRDEASGAVHRFLVEGTRLAVVLASRPGEMTFFAPDEKGWRTLIADLSIAVRFDPPVDGVVSSCTARVGAPDQTWRRVAAK